MNTWPTKKLKEVATYINGRAFKPTDWGETGLPIIRIQNLTKTQEKFNFFNGKVENRYLVKDGDILLSWSASLGVYIWNKGNAVLNQHIFKVVPNEDINKSYLFYSLIVAVEELKRRVHGSTMTHVTKPVFNRVAICIPPLNIQKQIVERLDKIAEAQKLNDGLIQKSDELFQSLLHKELNPAGPADAKAMAGKKNWEVKKLGDIVEVKGGKRVPKGMNFASGKTNHPYLRVTDFVDNSIKTDGLKYIDEKIFQHIKRYIISSKDIYISIAGTIGLVGKIPHELDGANLTENAAKLLIIKKIVDRDFLIFCLSTSTAKNQIKIFTQAVGVPKLALERIEKIKISLPSLKTQKQIVAKLSAAQDYKKQLLEQKAKLKELFDSVLHKSMSNK